MSYQQQTNGYAPVPGLSVGAVPLHFANSHGPEEEEYGDRYYEYNPPAGLGRGGGGGGGGGGSDFFGGLFDRIRSNRPLVLGVGFFLFMLLITSGHGGGNDGGSSSAVADGGSGGGDSSAVASGGSSGGSSSSSIGGGGSSDSRTPLPASPVGGSSSTGPDATTKKSLTNKDKAENAGTDEEEGDDEQEDDDYDQGGVEIPRAISWLAFFPLSGAYYASLVVRSLSVPTGTNYAMNWETHRPVFDESPTGPFMRGVSHGGSSDGDGTILVSTHCGGTCPSSRPPCPPSDFIETVLSFDEACRSTEYGDGKNRTKKGVYESTYVERMVHLARDPLANVASLTRSGPKNATGFQRWCEASSSLANGTNGDALARLIPRDVRAAMESIPCPFEFFRYVQWHNLAIEEATFRNLDRHVIYYEDFGRKGAEDVVDGLAEFFGVQPGGKRRDFPKFRSARMYGSYYTDEQKRAIWRLIGMIAMPKTLKLLERYRP